MNTNGLSRHVEGCADRFTWMCYATVMNDNIQIRSAVAADLAALERLYPAAFPDEDLLTLLRDLAAAGPAVQSWIAMRDETIVGHVMFTDCSVAGSRARLTMLGPLAVTPTRQNQGIGTSLVRDVLARYRADGVDAALVLGDPTYYGRFGFVAEDGIRPPYDLPPEWNGAWQSLRLSESRLPTGTIQLPALWYQKEYWAG